MHRLYQLEVSQRVGRSLPCLGWDVERLLSRCGRRKQCSCIWSSGGHKKCIGQRSLIVITYRSSNGLYKIVRMTNDLSRCDILTLQDIASESLLQRGGLCIRQAKKSYERTIDECPQVFHILHLLKGRPSIANFVQNFFSKTLDDRRVFGQHIHCKSQGRRSLCVSISMPCLGLPLSHIPCLFLQVTYWLTAVRTVSAR